ncbi:MAG: hypothetical protein MJZ77_06115 [Bacteroidales bacterium]|nr:hypothetical protein [Bacteroidales bacterium]
MKIKIISVALLAVLSTTAVSCQKDTVMDNVPVPIVSEVHTMQYAVNGVTHSVIIHNEAEEQALMQYLIALAREGYKVSIYNESAYTLSVSKETITYTTKNEKDAIAWTIKKTKEGYNVTYEYDSKTGEYTCTATR